MLEQKKEEEEQKGPTISENKEPSTNPNEPNTAEVKASEETKPSEPVKEETKVEEKKEEPKQEEKIKR